MNLDELSDEEFGELLESKRICSRCGKEQETGYFPMTTCRGITIIRKWCNECCKAYYREYGKKKYAARKQPNPSMEDRNASSVPVPTTRPN